MALSTTSAATSHPQLQRLSLQRLLGLSVMLEFCADLCDSAGHDVLLRLLLKQCPKFPLGIFQSNEALDTAAAAF